VSERVVRYLQVIGTVAAMLGMALAGASVLLLLSGELQGAYFGAWGAVIGGAVWLPIWWRWGNPP
jgi:hypothetical protein